MAQSKELASPLESLDQAIIDSLVARLTVYHLDNTDPTPIVCLSDLRMFFKEAEEYRKVVKKPQYTPYKRKREAVVANPKAFRKNTRFIPLSLTRQILLEALRNGSLKISATSTGAANPEAD